MFSKAQAIIRERGRRFTDEELLDQLRQLMEHEGRLSGLLIDEREGSALQFRISNPFRQPDSSVPACRVHPDRDYQFIETNRQLRLMHPVIIEDVIERIRQLGGVINRDPSTDLLTVNDEFTASLVIARCRHTGAGSYRWLIRLDSGLTPDITVAVRMDADNSAAFDYYLLPRIDMTFEKLLLAEDNGVSLDTYRFANLAFFLAWQDGHVYGRHHE